MTRGLADRSGAELGRLRWRCRRGMRELDVLLTRYVDGRYAGATQAERQAFLDLLEAPDPLIWAYCLGRETPPTAELCRIVEHLVSATAGAP